MAIFSVQRQAARRLAPALAVSLFALAMAGCASTPSDSTASISSSTPRSETEWRQAAEKSGDQFRANPNDPDAAMQYAQALRALGQRTQAVAVLEQAALGSPNHRALLGAYGKPLADVGQYKQAFEVLERAHTPENPDWRVLSAQGAVLDQLGRHQEAQRYYSSALKIVPGEPSVLSNLGLSYALAKDLPQDEAASNVAYLKQMLSQAKAGKKLGGAAPSAGT